MTVRSVPTFLQAGSHPAEETRLALAGFLRSPLGTAFSGGVGALDPGHGVTTPADLKVSQSGPGMNVSVAAGSGFIRGTQSALQGVYHVVNDAAVVLAVSPADPTNPRRDLVILHVRDANYSGASNDARLLVVTGTPAASPADPSLAAYPNALVLARLQVNAAPDATIVTGDITDLRSYAGAPAMEITCTSTTRPSSVAPGTRIYETDTGKRLVYYGATTGWRPPWGDPWGLVAAPVSQASNATITTTTTDYAAMTLAAAQYTLDRQYKATLLTSAVNSAGGANEFVAGLNTGASGVGTVLGTFPAPLVATGQEVAYSGVTRWQQASNVSQQVHVRFSYVAAASWSFQGAARSANQLFVEDMGPATATVPVA